MRVLRRDSRPHTPAIALNFTFLCWVDNRRAQFFAL
jgi:hypothetical protein